MNKITLTKQIEKYLDGELSAEQADQLWKEFLSDPESYDLFKTVVNLRDIDGEELSEKS